MARFGKRLSSFSRSGPLPQADLSDEQYQELEAIYGVPLTKGARGKLKEICDFYVIWREPEVDGQKFADAAALFKKVKAAVAAFTPLAFGILTPLTDAGKQMNELLERHLRSVPVQIPFKNILDEEGHLADESLEDARFQQIVLSMDTLMHVGIALQSAVDRVGKEIKQPVGSSGPVGFMPGQAFEDWARDLHDWAVEFSLPTSLLGNGDRSAPFTNFFFALNRMMPGPYQANIASEEALAQRIKRIRRKAE